MDRSTPSPRSVTVLVPTWQRPDELARALDGLARQVRRPDEVLVVVRAEDARSRAVVAAAPAGLPVREVLAPRPGLVAARNAGLDVATGDVVAFLDDDAVPAPTWLQRMLAHYDVPGVGAVGGRDRVHHDGVPVDQGERHDVGTLTWYGRWVALHHRGTGPARDVHHLKGVNMSLLRSACPDVRVDPGLRGRGAEVHEDSSVCLQVLARGLRVVYDPAVEVDHFEASRGADDCRQPVQLRARRDRQHNQTYVVARWFPLHRTAVHVLFSLLVGTGDAPGLVITGRDVLRSRSLRGHVTPLRANVQGRLAGLATAWRLRGVDPSEHLRELTAAHAVVAPLPRPLVPLQRRVRPDGEVARSA